MEITLRINGEDKKFVQEFVPLKIYRKALESEKYARQAEYDDEKLFDMRLNLIIEAFGKQFTKDELENGLNVEGHKEVFYNIIGVGILGYPSLEDQEDLGKLVQEIQEKSENESQSTKESKK
jgi:hypothetical protein